MSYMRSQFVERDETGRIINGIAAICEAVYARKSGKKSHSVQKQVRRLGKVTWLSDNGKSVIFLSKTRDLVEYSSIDNQFQKVAANDYCVYETIRPRNNSIRKKVMLNLRLS